jgi:ribosomal protein S28E/S33
VLTQGHRTVLKNVTDAVSVGNVIESQADNREAQRTTPWIPKPPIKTYR